MKYTDINNPGLPILNPIAAPVWLNCRDTGLAPNARKYKQKAGLK